MRFRVRRSVSTNVCPLRKRDIKDCRDAGQKVSVVFYGKNFRGEENNLVSIFVTHLTQEDIIYHPLR